MKNVPVTMGFHPKIYETKKVKKLRGLRGMIFEGIEDYMQKNVANLGKSNLETNKQTNKLKCTVGQLCPKLFSNITIIITCIPL